MARVLITGAQGAVGKPLGNAIAAMGHAVHGVDVRHSHEPNYERCDVAQYREISDVLRNGQFDVVFHAAAEFGRNNGEDYYERLWMTNVVGTKHVLRLQADLGFRLVLFSSSEVYGDWGDVMTEEVMVQQPIRQMNDYAISKWVNELQALNAADRYGTEIVRVRLFNTYGPGEYYSPYRSVICQFVYRALHNMPYTVYLNHHRTSTYIDDSISALANVIENFEPGEVFNIAGDEYHDIKGVSDMVLRQLGKDDNAVEYVEFEAHNTRDKRTSNAKARDRLNFRSTVNLEEGIRRTIDWQRTVYGVR